VCAIDRGFLYAASPGNGKRVRLREDSAEFEPVEFELDAAVSPPAGQWSNYPMTMARRLVRNFPRLLTGVDLVFSSTMPVGSGMSGSSALMMMMFAALASTNRLQAETAFTVNIRSPLDLSVYLACAENGQTFRGLAGDSGVGTFGGSEDHAAILNARPGLLSVFGFSPVELQVEVPWPDDWRMAVGFSGVRAEKTREALEKYNMASRRVREAVRRYNAIARTDFRTLREVVDHEPKPGGGRWRTALLRAPGEKLPGLADRVHQFILEDRTYIPGALGAMANNDLRAFGRFLSASHAASRKYLWNIVPEIHWLQRNARRLGAAGASGFGAGFGGSILAVTDADHAEDFLEAWRRRYTERFPDRAAGSAFFLAQPGPGIEVLTDSGPARLAEILFHS
jgi:galactokinase